ncbi:sugar nucleotidyltransferase [Metabacillus halosaccharovorans]|uniref:sugar nucleotidyltransferase n=1 Tax=Metabacillus halosaccharovorans TaxID=930124 RepID=UPI00203FC816|nr:sugar phosphate nucleotidyltransferase [Metabacillus halosaccharovorans]MCM3444716.1 sugar phosphate nucleotidyltransferase [Metabacillus halosaccharovorans]
MKGVILAGGSGTRLSPMTSIIGKHLLYVYDKPMVYYPLATLMSVGIKEILIIAKERDLPFLKKLLGDGSDLGINIQFAIEKESNGIAYSLIMAESYIGNESVCLILGDNIFCGHNELKNAIYTQNRKKGAYIWGYEVKDPQRFGIVAFNESKKVLDIQEKPKYPKSNYAITGFYVFDNKVIDYAKKIRKSFRNEYEITDVLQEYLQINNLKANILDNTYKWFDVGTPASLLEASNYIYKVFNEFGYSLGCIEEVAYEMGYITIEQLENLITKLPSCSYKTYLETILRSDHRSLSIFL